MITAAQTKFVPIQFAEAAENTDDLVGAYGDANPVSIDTQGFSHCTVYVYVGTIGAAAMSALGIYEGPAAASGADDATYSAVTGLQASGSTGDGRLPQGGDDDTLVAFDIDLRGRERFLALDATAGAADTWLSAWAVLSRGEEAPTLDADRGLEWSLNA